MTDTVFLVYLARDGLFVVAKYAGELGFWSSRSFLFLYWGLMRVYIPSGPRLFDADGGGFRDDFFRLPMVSKKEGRRKWWGTGMEAAIVGLSLSWWALL